MVVEVPDDVLRDWGLTADDVRREAAIGLFRDGRCTLSRASRLAGLSPIQFQRLLAGRQTSVHYGAEEFRQDLDSLCTVGLLWSSSAMPLR